MILMLTKSGGVFRTREYIARASTSGENGETEGLMRYLDSTWPGRLIYFGAYDGESIGKWEVVQPHIDGLDHNSSPAEQQAGWRADEELIDTIIGSDNVLAYLNATGYSPTMSCIDNPNHAIVQAAAVRYTAPMLNMIRYLKVPRVLINNDPRCYPKEQEMSMLWPELIPAVLLDQISRDRPQVVGGKKYIRRSVYSGCESWAYHIPADDVRAFHVTVLAHAHLRTGIRSGSDAAWAELLGDDLTKLPEHFAVYGEGWEHFSNYHKLEPCFLGKLRQREVTEVLTQTMFCPVVSHSPGFYTGKPFVLVAAGCVPLLYRGLTKETFPYTWDMHERYLSFDDPLRVSTPADLCKQFDYDAELARWKELSKPRFELLDKLLDELLDYRPGESWWSRWGGYASL